MSRAICAIALLCIGSSAVAQTAPLKQRFEERQSEYTRHLAESDGDRESEAAARQQWLADIRKMAEEAEAAETQDHRVLAAIYSVLNEPRQALKHVSQALDEGPADEKLYMRQITSLTRLRDLAGAERAVANALAEFPDSTLLRCEELLVDTAQVGRLLRRAQVGPAQQRLKADRDKLADYREKFPSAAAQWDSVEHVLDRFDGRVVMAQTRVALIGQPAIAIGDADWVNGGPLAPADLQGKVVLLAFWNMGSDPCIATFPHLRRWLEQFQSQGLVIVGVTDYHQMNWDATGRQPIRTDGLPPEQERAALEGFLKHHQLTNAVAVLKDQAAKPFFAAYGVSSCPQAVVIDRAGKVRMIRGGGGDENIESLEKSLRECLAEGAFPSKAGEKEGAMSTLLAEQAARNSAAATAERCCRRSDALACLAALLLLWGAFAVETLLSVRRTEGHFTYCLDDAYIHMAIAKHVVVEHVYGVTPYAFSASSSSLLWTALLSAAFLAAGPNELVPLAFNVVLATGVVIFAWIVLRRYKLHPAANCCALAALILFTPLVPVALTGLEHMLHILATLALACAAARALDDGATAWQRARAAKAALALAPLVTMARYEGLFLILIVAVLFTLRRRLGLAFGVLFTGCLPVLLSGIWFVSHGWFFLPVSVVLKGGGSLAGLLQFSPSKLGANAHLTVLLCVAALAGLRYGARLLREPRGVLCVIFIGVTLLHLIFAAVGWFFRYEAYLVSLGLLAVALLLDDCWRASPAAGGLSRRQTLWCSAAPLALLALPLVARSCEAHVKTPLASMNIHQQQYQMGRFLARYYEGRSVAANDVGAINYLADLHCLDLWGLADLRVARLKLARRFDTSAIRELVREDVVEAALVSEAWFKGDRGLPPEWTRVGQWTIVDNVIGIDESVSFYAADPASAARLRKQMMEFESELPSGVEVRLEAEPASVMGEADGLATPAELREQ